MRFKDYDEFDKDCMRIEIAQLAERTGLFLSPITGDILDRDNFDTPEDFTRCVSFYLEQTES